MARSYHRNFEDALDDRQQHSFALMWEDRQYSLRDISRRFGVSDSRWASRIAKKLGLPSRKKTKESVNGST